MLVPRPIVFRKRRARTKPRKVATPVVVGPVLVAASYDDSTFTLSLTFDRAVNVVGAEMVPESITILDGVNSSELLNSYEVYGSGTATLAITMFGNAPWAGSGVTMTANDNTGIVDEADVAWSGVTGISLPLS